MSDVANWKAGKADAAWKVMVCARDAARADELLSGVAYILAGAPGGRNQEECARIISQFSGQQIAEALVAFRESAHQSVVNGMGGQP